MGFKSLYITYAPNADPNQHRSVIDTGNYKLFSVAVTDQAQAIEAAQELIENEGIHSIVLCPGFTHQEVGKFTEAVGENVAVSIARTDGPGHKVSAKIIKQEGLGSKTGTHKGNGS